MLDKVLESRKNILQAYEKEGYIICPVDVNGVMLTDKTHTFAASRIFEKSSNKPLNTGFAISIADIAFFFGLSNLIKFNRIFIIGNAYGYSTFMLAELFNNALVDAIDAEVEGTENKLGSDITRTIAKKYYPNVNLTTGFSPQDLKKSMRADNYDLVFIDGLHTNEQLLKDFNGIMPFCNKSCLIYMHDIGVHNMHQAYETIKKTYTDLNYYDVDFTVFGCKVAIRNYPLLSSWFNKLVEPRNNIEKSLELIDTIK